MQQLIPPFSSHPLHLILPYFFDVANTLQNVCYIVDAPFLNIKPLGRLVDLYSLIAGRLNQLHKGLCEISESVALCIVVPRNRGAKMSKAGFVLKVRKHYF